MADRYHGYEYATPTTRANTFGGTNTNPARQSLPASIGYSSLYAGDMHVMPPSTRQPVTTPRGVVTTTNTSGGPSTTTRTYAVTQDPRSQRPTTRDVTRGNRSSTLDSTTGRPPVIVMTTQQKDRQGSSGRSSSPIRDDYRASEGQVYTQPASSIRSRTPAYPYGDQIESDGYSHSRERSNSLAREADAYRSSRPSVVYPSNPRHSSATIDYGDDGYQYTNAGDLVRYDLDHSGPNRPRRHESFDRGYHRPNLNYNTDQRVLNVNTNTDSNRNYITTTTNRPYDNRGGPPPSTRGFDRVNRAYETPTTYESPTTYETPHDMSLSTPALPDPASIGKTEPVVVSTEARRPRPVSLYQEAAPRSVHHDDFYRSREDERNMREHREADIDRTFEPERQHADPSSPYFHDDRVATRGFGIRTESFDNYDDRRDKRREHGYGESKKRSDEDLPREGGVDREERRRSRIIEPKETRRERRESKKGNDEDEKDRSRFRDKMAAGLGIAATAMGLSPSSKSDDKRDTEKDSKTRKDVDDRTERRRRESDAREKPRASERDRSRARDYEQPRYEYKTNSEGYKPVVESYKPTSESYKPATESYKPTSESYKPTSESYKPTSESYKPVVESYKPTSESYKPTSESYKPTSESYKPAVESYKPISESRENSRRDVDPRKSNDAIVSASDSDENKKNVRRNRNSAAFNPNDASELTNLKQQLAALKASEQNKEGQKDRPMVVETTRSKSTSPTKESVPTTTTTAMKDNKPIKDNRSSKESSRSPSVSKSPSDSKSTSPDRDASRGRQLSATSSEVKQVRVVSPPRDKKEDKPLKGILKQSRAFPEEPNPIREGVAPHKDDKKFKEAPPGAKWTKISRKIVNPEALTVGKERFEVRDDFVIVLRVLSKEEIQAYAAATQVLRERRRNENGDKDRERDRDSDRDRDRERDRDNDRDRGDRDRDRDRGDRGDRDRDRDDDRKGHRHRRHRDEDEMDTEERDRERRRRLRDDDDYESRAREPDHHHHHHHSHRSQRDRESIAQA